MHDRKGIGRVSIAARMATAWAIASLMTACAPQMQNPDGVAAKRVDTAVQAPSGVGIEGRDIQAMTDQMMRDILATPALAGRAKAPRIVIDSQDFHNEGSQAINRDLITNRLRISLNRAAQGRMTFVTRTDMGMVEQERAAKRAGETDVGTTGMAKAKAGADFRMRGAIASSDARNVKTGMIQRYNQVTFEMVDLETAEIVWGGIYEFSATGAEDGSYR